MPAGGEYFYKIVGNAFSGKAPVSIANWDYLDCSDPSLYCIVLTVVKMKEQKETQVETPEQPAAEAPEITKCVMNVDLKKTGIVWEFEANDVLEKKIDAKQTGVRFVYEYDGKTYFGNAYFKLDGKVFREKAAGVYESNPKRIGWGNDLYPKDARKKYFVQFEGGEKTPCTVPSSIPGYVPSAIYDTLKKTAQQTTQAQATVQTLHSVQTPPPATSQTNNFRIDVKCDEAERKALPSASFLKPGESTSVTFDKAGKFSYFDYYGYSSQGINQALGTIIVE